MISRRSFLGGLIAAPAVVQFANLMPVRGIIMPVEQNYTAVIVDGQGNVLGRTAAALVERNYAIFSTKFRFEHGEVLKSGEACAMQLEKNGKLLVRAPILFPQNIVNGNSFTLSDFDIRLDA